MKKGFTIIELLVMRKRAFTLIELLVVIAIIGILAAMILGSLFAAQSKANDTRVKTAMSQIRTEAAMYYGANSTLSTYTISPNIITDIKLKNGTHDDPVLILGTDGLTFAVQTTLSNGSTTYCIDSTGRTTKGGTLPDASNAACNGPQQ